MPEAFFLQNPLPISLLLTDKFNSNRSYGRHEGIDLKAIDSQGNPVEVLAAQRGIVVKTAFYGPGYGNYVVVRHEWEDGNVYATWYGHLSRTDVRAGEFVAAGSHIGIAGSTGNSTGVHLHLNLQHIGHGLSGYVVPDVVDPWPFFSQVQPATKQLMFIADETIPDGTLLQPGTEFIKTWRVANSGTVAWQAGDELVFASGEQMDGPSSIPLPALKAGEQASLSIAMKAPQTQGRHNGVWKGRGKDGKAFDFPLWVEILTAGASAADGAKYLADASVPDGTVFAPGQTFLKEWRVRNSGSSAWRSGYRLAHVDDERLGAPESVAVPYTRAGEEALVSVSLKAPPTPGNYRSTWQMRNLEGQPFGELLFALIRVQPEVAAFSQLSFVSDVTFPPDTRLTPGQAFRKVWRVRNTGQMAWDSGYRLAHRSGESFGALPGNIPQNALHAIFDGDEVIGGAGLASTDAGSLELRAAPGETIDLALDLTSPSQPGLYEGVWMAHDAAGVYFDQALVLRLQVVGETTPGQLVDGASFVKDVTVLDGSSIPAGSKFLKTWRVRNSGSSTWGPGYLFDFLGNEQMGGQARQIPLTAPGEVQDISLELNAPLVPGQYRSSWRIKNPQGQFFGDELYTLIQVPSVTPAPADNRAQFIEHVTVKLWEVIPAGTVFEKIWKVRNQGRSTWSGGYTAAYLDGERMNGAESVAAPYAETLMTVQIAVTLTAPSTAGYYQGYWKLRDPSGKFFGPRLPVWIRVK